MRENLPVKPDSDILLYQTEDGQTRVEVQLRDDTVWLSQKLMADLFQKDVRTINEHIKNILVEGEQASEATIRKFRIVQIVKGGQMFIFDKSPPHERTQASPPE